MQIRHQKFLFFGLNLFFVGWASSGQAGSAFSENLVQPSVLEAPGRGSLAGEWGSTRWGAAEFSQGSFSLPIGIRFPDERGPLVYPVSPLYSPTQGLSEWGMGVKTPLSIVRFRIQGEVDFKTDDLMSPGGG